MNMHRQTLLTAVTGLALMAGSANAALLQTVDTSAFTADSNNNETFFVKADGSSVVYGDLGAGAARLSTQTITDPGSDILNFAATFVFTATNTSGDADHTYLAIGDGTNVFANTYIGRSNGVDRFGAGSAALNTLNGGNGNSPIGATVVTPGTEYTVSIFLNNTGGSLSYTDPASGSQTLADGTYDLWFGATDGALSLIVDGQAKLDSVADLDTVTYYIVQANAVEHTSTWNPIPEPGSLALLGMGGLLMIKRRRRD
ncbi:MAG: PEP-CTERM sorting domain-containing protein [Phycisphaeraceae bacterium]